MSVSVPELVRRARAAGWVLAPLRPPRNLAIDWTRPTPPDNAAYLALGRLLDRRRVQAVRALLLAEMEQRRSSAAS